MRRGLIPTINQLVRKGRQVKKQNLNRHLNVGYNSLKKEQTNLYSHKNVGYVLVLQ